MRAIPTTIVMMAAVATAAVAFAASPRSGLDSAALITKVRYTMTPTDGGFIRMDTQTGVLSFCSTKSGSLNCNLVPDDRLALEKDLERLKQKNRELRDDNKRLEDMVLGVDQNSNGSGKTSKRAFRFPSEEEVDKALGYVERMYKKFRDKLRDLEADRGGGSGTEL